MNVHSKNKKNLVEQIGDAEKNLNDLKKKSQNTLVSTVEPTSSKNKDQTEVNINIDDILNDLKKDILNVYKKTTDSSHADFHTKQPIDMLCVTNIWLMVFVGN